MRLTGKQEHNKNQGLNQYKKLFTYPSLENRNVL